jgi:hypothetical protein
MLFVPQPIPRFHVLVQHLLPVQLSQDYIHLIENTNFVLWRKALVKWSASPTEKEHGEIDPSVVGVRELRIQYV